MQNIIEQLREDTQQLMQKMHTLADAERATYRKYLVNGYDMLNLSAEAMDCLLEPILPRTGVAALVGTSDSGKSTLLRGLAMAVASGSTEYLGFRLCPKHRSAIYVATEDSKGEALSGADASLRSSQSRPCLLLPSRRSERQA